MPATPEEYAAELKRLLADIAGLTETSGDRMTAILEDARATIISQLGELDWDSPTRALLDRALGGVNDALRTLQTTATAELAGHAETAFDLGAQLATRPLGPDFAVVGAQVTQTQLALTANFSAELVGNVTSDLRRRITAEITGVVVGAKTPQEAAKAIGRNLRDPNHFRTIAHRARAIVVTETGRAQALGTQAAQQSLAETQAGVGGPAPRKSWLNAHLPGARPTHLSAEARYAEGATPGPIPIDEHFVINGHRALYPRDPSLPASETVNCHCTSITVLPDAEGALGQITGNQPTPH